MVNEEIEEAGRHVHRQKNKCYPQFKGVCLLFSKLHSILAVANLLAHNNKSQICYCCQILSQCAAVNCSFSDNLTPLEVTFILLAMVHYVIFNTIIEGVAWRDEIEMKL